jgi:ABC-type nitrate/sulfonate/bicarbonate transport system substrate-binding protein
MKIKSKLLGILMGSIIGLGITTQSHAQANLTEIKVSYQPALYWALPFYVATEKNWWAELGLKPTFSTFPAGVPQIAASASKSWDVGGTGSVPAVLGYVRFGIKTIGIMDINKGTENLFYVLDDVRDKRYYYYINDEQLKSDGELFDSITEQIEDKITDLAKAMFGVYPSQYKDNYCYVVYSSPHIQGVK